jgi:hypothetical protein
MKTFFIATLLTACLGSPIPLTKSTLETTLSIPLGIYQISPGEYKIGITIGLGGGAPLLYEFDTGSSGLQSGYNAQFWPNFTPTGKTSSISYFSGNVYNSSVVSTQVTFYNGSTPVAKIQGAQVGLITNASNYKTPSKLAKWDMDMASGEPPLFGQFYGDFGIGLSHQNSLFPLLQQLPAPLNQGFVIKLGKFPLASNTIGKVASGTLQLGLTAKDAVYPIQAPLNPASNPLPFPNPSGNDFVPITYNSTQVLQGGSLTLSGLDKTGTTKDVTFATGLLMDTGAPTTTIHDLSNQFNIPTWMCKGKRLVNGYQPIMKFKTGKVSSLNQVSMATSNAAGNAGSYVNTGLNLFFQYNVCFNLVNATVGLQPQ